MPFSKFKDFCERSRSELFVVYAGGCPRRAGLPARCGSSLQRNDAGVWLCEYPGLSFQRSPVCACSLVSSLLLSGATMSQQSSLTQSAHSVRQVLTDYTPQQIGPYSITASLQRAFRSCPSWTISRTDPAHEVGHGVANLVGAILLEEMAPFHRHFGLVQPGAATFPLPADQNRTWIRMD